MGPLDSALGVSPHALALRASRTELLAANIANADTPGFKARDIDFSAAMRNAVGDQESMTRTDQRHMNAGGTNGPDPAPLYRVPGQPSLDGNTVDSQREHAEFMDNAIRYQASINFLDSRIRGLQTAIRGQA